MCEADLSSADQVVIFKGDFACLQAINLTNSTTGDLVFMGGTKFLPVGVSSQQNVVRWNSLIIIDPPTKCGQWNIIFWEFTDLGIKYFLETLKSVKDDEW